jgi:putative flippase GtrA
MTARSVTPSPVPGFERRRFGLFVVLGGCAAAANWLSRFPLQRFMPFSAAVVIAYLVGMAIAFFLFARFVFPSSQRRLADQVKFFVLVNIVGIAQVWVVSISLVDWIFPGIGLSASLAEPIAHGVAIGVPTISSYFGHKMLTFKT